MKLNVLTIAPFYRFFVKDPTEAIAKHISNVEVFIHHNYLSELARFLPFSYFRHVEMYSKRNLVDLKNKPENVAVHVLSTLYFIPDGRNPSLGDKLFEIFEKYIKQNDIEFDIIHAHFTYPQGYVGVKLKEEFGVPLVVTLHENGPHLNSVLSNVKDKAIYVWKNADMLIRVNKKDIPTFVQYGAPTEKITYIPNGYNPEKFPIVSKIFARNYLNLNEKSNIIFNLSRLYPVKGHKYLIEAMSLVVKERDDVLCFIGGSGPLKGELEKQIKDRGLQEHVKLLGFVSDEELKYWMNAADLFVLPSLSEGNPTVMFEALGVGLPFVGTKVGGVPEIIISEDYGLLCEPANPKELAEKILIALEKEWDREKIRKYAEQFTWENIAKKTLEVYRGVLK